MVIKIKRNVFYSGLFVKIDSVPYYVKSKLVNHQYPPGFKDLPNDFFKHPPFHTVRETEKGILIENSIGQSGWASLSAFIQVTPQQYSKGKMLERDAAYQWNLSENIGSHAQQELEQYYSEFELY
ncbi:MAG: hypothetical protein ACYDAO_04250 [Thermoplasmataceae archaeon]